MFYINGHIYTLMVEFLESVLNCVLFLRKNNNNQVSHIFSSCFVSQLAKHMEKCNSKPQPLPEYIKENINVIDSNVEEIKVNLGTLSDEELLAIISRVSKIHSGGCRHLLKVKKNNVSFSIYPEERKQPSLKASSFMPFYRFCWRTANFRWTSSSSRAYTRFADGESWQLASRLSILIHFTQSGSSWCVDVGKIT